MASLYGVGSLAYWASLIFWRPGKALSALCGPTTPFPHKFSGAAAWLTLCAVYYAGFSAMLGWLPDTWGWLAAYEDGESYWVTLRGVISFALAVAAGIASPVAAEAVARIRAESAN